MQNATTTDGFRRPHTRVADGSRTRVARAAADLAGVTMVGIGALHALWGLTDSGWPARDQSELAASVLSGATELPGPLPCLGVTGALTAASVLLQARTRPEGACGWIPFGLAGLGVKVAGTVFAVRGIGGLIVSGLGRDRDPRNRRLDLMVFSPLCLALAAAHWAALRPATGPAAARVHGNADG